MRLLFLAVLAAGALAVWRHRENQTVVFDDVDDALRWLLEPEDGVQGVDPWPASFVDLTYYPAR